jgi:hypothetical protein
MPGNFGGLAGSGQSCVDPEPGPTPTPSDPPQCSITEFARGVPFAGSPGSHTYIQIIDPVYGGAAGTDDILEGGPTNPHSPFKGGPWGQLTGIISGTTDATQPLPLRGDNPTTNTVLGTETGGAAVCYEALQLLNAVLQYNYLPSADKANYAPLPNGKTTFNSNSFTYTLLSQIGLAGVFGQPAWAPGWGFIVPGL